MAFMRAVGKAYQVVNPIAMPEAVAVAVVMASDCEVGSINSCEGEH